MTNLYPHGPEYPLLVFSSHSWAHGHHREGLHELLAPDWIKGVDYHDLSVPEEHPLHYGDDHDRLVMLLSERIANCDVVLAMAGVYASHSYWINVEVRLANIHKKPILAIAPNGQQRLSRVATGLSKYEPIRWRGNSVRTAILVSLDPKVRQNFLAARKWRQRIRTETVSRLLRERGPAMLRNALRP